MYKVGPYSNHLQLNRKADMLAHGVLESLRVVSLEFVLLESTQKNVTKVYSAYHLG
jgi:hypothetical protein